MQLKGSGAKISIATKSDLILRDLDLIKTFPEARVSWSVNTLDEDFRSDMDQAAPIERRLAAMEVFHNAGIRTTCFVSPIFPGITDIEAIVRRVKHQCNLYLAGESESSGRLQESHHGLYQGKISPAAAFIP